MHKELKEDVFRQYLAVAIHSYRSRAVRTRVSCSIAATPTRQTGPVRCKVSEKYEEYFCINKCLIN